MAQFYLRARHPKGGMRSQIPAMTGKTNTATPV